MTEEEFKIFLSNLTDVKRRTVQSMEELKKAKAKKNIETIGSLALTLSGGLPKLLSKVPAIEKLVSANKGLGKVMKFLDPASKTTREGYAFSKTINKLINRLVPDLLIKDIKFTDPSLEEQSKEIKKKEYSGEITSGLKMLRDLYGPQGLQENPYSGQQWE